MIILPCSSSLIHLKPHATQASGGRFKGESGASLRPLKKTPGACILKNRSYSHVKRTPAEFFSPAKIRPSTKTRLSRHRRKKAARGEKRKSVNSRSNGKKRTRCAAVKKEEGSEEERKVKIKRRKTGGGGRGACVTRQRRHSVVHFPRTAF